jgi:chemotaxis protein MotB
MTKEAARAALSPEVATEPDVPAAPAALHSAEQEHVGGSVPDMPSAPPVNNVGSAVTVPQNVRGG